MSKIELSLSSQCYTSKLHELHKQTAKSVTFEWLIPDYHTLVAQTTRFPDMFPLMTMTFTMKNTFCKVNGSNILPELWKRIH